MPAVDHSVTENTFLHRLMLRLSAIGSRVFRNQVGTGWYGKLLSRVDTAEGTQVTLANARPLKAGLCIGSSDTIGWHTLEITPEMVGRRIAVFLAVEVKTDDGRLTGEQEQFLRVVREAGGIAYTARGEEGIAATVELVKGWPGQG